MKKKRIKMFVVATLIIGLAVFLGRLPILATEYNEAPALRTLVAAGELPPLEERLPDEPLVVKPGGGEIGVYGGVFVTTPDTGWYLFEEYPINVEIPECVKPIPNIIKAWEISEDATEVIFFLRRGMKWSDGHPFTADDWMFWYNDIEGNKEFTPVRRTWYTIGGEHGILTKIDEYAIKWSFAATFGSFVGSLSEWPVRGERQFAPAHYLKQFHPDYTLAEELEKTMKDGGYDTWMDLLGTKLDFRNNPELPVLSSWMVINEWGAAVQIWERNPYFWKVDPKGNQLPYIDRMETPRSAGTEADLLRLIAGELDKASLSAVGGLNNFTIMMENREKGDYRTIRAVEGEGAAHVGAFFFNVHHKDSAKRELFNNLDFRKALSVAINRQEIIDVTYKGIGTPTQICSATGPPYHGERPEFKEYYTQYDPELANQFLDAIGLTERDNKGYRLGPDGKELLIVLQVVSDWIQALPHIADMYKEYFAVVGVNSIVKPMPGGLCNEIVGAAEHDIFVRYFAGGNVLQSPANGYLFPRGTGWQTAPLWARWLLTDGEEGEEPPDWVKRVAAIDGEAKAEIDLQTRFDLYAEATLLHVNELMPVGCFAVGGGGTSVHIVGNRIRNVPDPLSPWSSGMTGQVSSWYIPEER